MTEDLHYLDFGVKKSIRYHAQRKGFFEGWHYFSTVVTTISGTSAFAALWSNNPKVALWLTGVIAIISSLDLTIGFSRRAEVYDRLQKRFSDLLIEMMKESPSLEDLKKWKAERVLIEKDEPTKLKVLDVLCHNELVVAEGYPENELCKIGFFKKFFRHFWSFDGWCAKKTSL